MPAAEQQFHKTTTVVVLYRNIESDKCVVCRLVNEVISFAAVVVTRRNEKARARGSDADGALVKAQYRVKKHKSLDSREFLVVPCGLASSSAGVQALSWRRRGCTLLLPEHEREHDRDAAEAEEHLHGTNT